MLFLFANGKAARVELSAYQTKSNRRKLTGAYSDRSELRGIFLLQEDVQLVLYSTEGRALILQTPSWPQRQRARRSASPFSRSGARQSSPAPARLPKAAL